MQQDLVSIDYFVPVLVMKVIQLPCLGLSESLLAYSYGWITASVVVPGV